MLKSFSTFLLIYQIYLYYQQIFLNLLYVQRYQYPSYYLRYGHIKFRLVMFVSSFYHFLYRKIDCWIEQRQVVKVMKQIYHFYKFSLLVQVNFYFLMIIILIHQFQYKVNYQQIKFLSHYLPVNCLSYQIFHPFQV